MSTNAQNTPKAAKLTPVQLKWLKSLALMEELRRPLTYAERASSTEPTRYKCRTEGWVTAATYLILHVEEGRGVNRSKVSFGEVSWMLTDAGRALIGLPPRDPAAFEEETLLHAAWARQRKVVAQVKVHFDNLMPSARRLRGYGEAADGDDWLLAITKAAGQNRPLLMAAAREVEEALARVPHLAEKLRAEEAEVEANDAARIADFMRGRE